VGELGGLSGQGLVSRADRIRPLHSAVVGEVCLFFASSTSPSGRYRLVAMTPSRDLFVCAKDLFFGAKPGQPWSRVSLLLNCRRHTQCSGP
jgi:hypothetical protein